MGLKAQHFCILHFSFNLPPSLFQPRTKNEIGLLIWQTGEESTLNERMIKRAGVWIINLLFPPAAVCLLTGLGADLFINCILFLLGIIPSHIHASYITWTYFRRKRKVRKGVYPGPWRPLIYSERVQNGGASNREVAQLKRLQEEADDKSGFLGRITSRSSGRSSGGASGRSGRSRSRRRRMYDGHNTASYPASPMSPVSPISSSSMNTQRASRRSNGYQYTHQPQLRQVPSRGSSRRTRRMY